MLKELDVSSNALEGPVGPSTVPSLSYLETLHLSDNTFASIRRGALAGDLLTSYLSNTGSKFNETRKFLNRISLSPLL